MSTYPQLVNTVLDATDTRQLAEFYRQLLGLVYRPGDEPPAAGPDDDGWLVLLTPDGHRLLAFQKVEMLHRTTWPSPDVPMQMHLCFYVDVPDRLDDQRRRAEALGAVLLRHRTDEPDEPLFVRRTPPATPSASTPTRRRAVGWAQRPGRRRRPPAPVRRA